MSPVRHRLRAGLLLSTAVLWVIAGAVLLLVSAVPGPPRFAQAQSAPAQAPAAAAATDTAAQPADEKPLTAPDEAETDAAEQAGNAADAEKMTTPGASAAAGAQSGATESSATAPMTSDKAEPTTQITPGRLISWGNDYRGYTKVTGYINSLEHGNRLGVTYVTPPEAATIYRQHAALVRDNKRTGFGMYPAGTVIVMETWRKSASGAPDTQGPIFFMRKEPGGFDAEGRDWSYGFTDAMLGLIAEGRDGKVTFCRGCHVSVANRDAVFAVDR